MAGFYSDEDRRVIPRWRTFSRTLGMRELESSTAKRAGQRDEPDYLAPKLADWRGSQTIGHAADVIGAAVVLRRGSEVRDVAQVLLRREGGLSPWLKELAEAVLETQADSEIILGTEATETLTFKERVRTIRHRLRIAARDPITWVDLAHAYAGLGLGKRAAQSMTVGLQLGANNRFVLRSASRLWVHLDDPEKAHDIIRKAERTPHDPWLLAAEIAVGSIGGRRPTFVKAARRILTEGRFSPSHISELAAAVATVELGAGSVKKSRRLFGQSLEQPTENSIAQAGWASRRNESIPLAEEYLTRPHTFEARSWSFYAKGRWKAVLEECAQWRDDQPFSSRPCVQGSYVAAVAVEDYGASARFAEYGLVANPKDFMLLNNLAFAQINRRDVGGAEKTLARIDRLPQSEQDRAVLYATRGLWEYRRGNRDRGRDLYAAARSEARKMQSTDGGRRFALASFFQAVEEARGSSSAGETVLSEASVTLQKVRDPIFELLLKRLDGVK